MLIYYRVGNQILIDEHDVMTIQDPKIGNPNMVNGRGDRNSGDGLDEEQSRMKAKYLRMLGERYPNVYIEIEEQKLGNRVMGAWVDRTKRKLLGYFPLQEWPRDAGTTAIAEVRSAS